MMQVVNGGQACRSYHPNILLAERMIGILDGSRMDRSDDADYDDLRDAAERIFWPISGRDRPQVPLDSRVNEWHKSSMVCGGVSPSASRFSMDGAPRSAPESLRRAIDTIERYVDAPLEMEFAIVPGQFLSNKPKVQPDEVKGQRSFFAPLGSTKY